MASKDNEVEFKVRIQQDGVSELASDLNKVESASEGLSESSEATGEALEKMGEGAKDAGADVKSLGTSIDSKTAAIRASLQAEQSEIAIQQQLLNAAKAEQQARLQSAKARGDQTAAAQASKAIIALEADQSQLLAQRLRNEATAIQAATVARREQLAAVGPLTQAQQQELLASENQAKALRVQAAAADTSSQHTRELSTNVQQLETRSQALNTELTSVAKALGVCLPPSTSGSLPRTRSPRRMLTVRWLSASRWRAKAQRIRARAKALAGDCEPDLSSIGRAAGDVHPDGSGVALAVVHHTGCARHHG